VTRPAPARHPVRILPLGDSLTWGKGSTDHTGYRAHLHRALTAAGLDVDFVGSQHNGTGRDTDHEGHPGWRIDQIGARLGPWLRATDPDVVLLDIGTNDYVQRYGVARAPDRLAALVDRIALLAPDTHIVLAKLLVIAGDHRGAGVRELNAAVPRIAAARRARVTVADMSRISVANTVDGVHPTDAGYRQMAYQWLQALRTVLPTGRAWPGTADPFPLPAVGTSAVRDGPAVTVTVRLTGRLTAVDLGNVTVRLRYRRAGTQAWTGLGTARTDARGTARFLRRITAAGDVAAVVVSGRAAGRSSTAVRLRGVA
jgi:lysophospholipase L1-like esterase